MRVVRFETRHDETILVNPEFVQLIAPHTTEEGHELSELWVMGRVIVVKGSVYQTHGQCHSREFIATRSVGC
jgi:hypothetical protein